MPLWPLFIYSVYCAASVASCVLGLVDLASMNANILSTLMNMIGTSLFLLQAFRVNASYDRWWEGRKLWDSIQAASADLGRLALGCITDKDVSVGIIKWIMAFASAARDQLRHTHDVGALDDILPPEDVTRWKAARSKPKYAALMITQLLSQAVTKGTLSTSMVGSCNANISQMLTALGSCSRIKHSPPPFAYIIHFRSFLMLWLMVLPWTFVQTLQWWTLGACITLGYQLLGFEEIAVEIESPFGLQLSQLDLDGFVEDIHNDMQNKLAFITKPVHDEHLSRMIPVPIS